MARACLTRPRRCTASEIFLGWPHNRLMIAAAMPPDCLFSTAETLHLSQSDSNRLSPVAPIAFTRPPSLLLLRHLRSRTGGCRPHWVVAACDGDPGVERIADAAIRKRQNANLDDPLLVDALLALVLGAKPAAPGQAAAAAADADPLTGRTATSTPVRLRALSLLARSMGAASRFPGTLQVRTSDWLWSGFDGLRVALLAHRKLSRTLQAIFHSLFGTDATPKLQVAGLQLAVWTVQHCSEPLLVAAGGHLLAGMLKVGGRPLMARDA